MKKEITYLFVPANKINLFSKALNCSNGGNHAIIIDLEDSVCPEEKNQGRENILNWLSTLNLALLKNKIYIRINNIKDQEFNFDINMLNSIIPKTIHGIVIPKLEDSNVIHEIKNLLKKEVTKLPFIGIIETARGVHYCDSIANSGVNRLAFGSLDYSLDINCQQTPEALLYARSRIVIASKLANLIAPIDCVTPEFATLENLYTDSLHAYSLGYRAKLCIHPKQVPVILETFTPSEQMKSWAKDVMTQAKNNYAFQINGSMIDLPLIKKANQILKE